MQTMKCVVGAIAVASTLCLGARSVERPGDDPAAWREVVSNDGSWKVQWRLAMESKPVEIPVARRRFSLELKITSTRGEKDEMRAVTIDAQMPEHHHGMNVAPTITLERGGSARADGMLFHMSGKWEVDVDIDDGFTVERAQWDIGMY